jgi:hypothetical protein
MRDEGTEHAGVADLDDQRGALLVAAARGTPVPAGRLWGLPDLGDDCWVDIAGASVLAGVDPRTITSWLARGGPKRNPFPAGHRLLYRLYWPKATIEAWTAERSATGPVNAG